MSGNILLKKTENKKLIFPNVTPGIIYFLYNCQILFVDKFVNIIIYVFIYFDLNEIF